MHLKRIPYMIMITSYRTPMDVREFTKYNSYNRQFPICPRCKVPIEREFQNYCDRCGQALSWKWLLLHINN